MMKATDEWSKVAGTQPEETIIISISIEAKSMFPPLRDAFA
jgi:hypothetical protein